MGFLPTLQKLTACISSSKSNVSELLFQHFLGWDLFIAISESSLGPTRKRERFRAEPATRSREATRQGRRRPEAARSSTGPSRRKLSPRPARPRPPCFRRRSRDGTERRRGQAARRASSRRPGPGPAPSPPPRRTQGRGTLSERFWPYLRRQLSRCSEPWRDLNSAGKRELENRKRSGRPCPSSI